jgi:hypothetical protein
MNLEIEVHHDPERPRPKRSVEDRALLVLSSSLSCLQGLVYNISMDVSVLSSSFQGRIASHRTINRYLDRPQRYTVVPQNKLPRRSKQYIGRGRQGEERPRTSTTSIHGSDYSSSLESEASSESYRLSPRPTDHDRNEAWRIARYYS